MDKFKKQINLERTFYSWYNYKNELPIDHKWITYIIANLQSMNIECFENDTEVYVLILKKKYIWTKKQWVYSIVEVKQLYFGN